MLFFPSCFFFLSFPPAIHSFIGNNSQTSHTEPAKRNENCSGKQAQIQQQSRESNFALLHMLTAECLDAGEATVRRSAAAGVGCVALRGAVSPVPSRRPSSLGRDIGTRPDRSARSRRWRAVLPGLQALQWTSFCAAAPPSVSGPARPG